VLILSLLETIITRFMAWDTAAACPVLGIAAGGFFILQVTMDVGIAAIRHGACMA
jgi:hypothetical protein